MGGDIIEGRGEGGLKFFSATVARDTVMLTGEASGPRIRFATNSLVGFFSGLRIVSSIAMITSPWRRQPSRTAEPPGKKPVIAIVYESVTTKCTPIPQDPYFAVGDVETLGERINRTVNGGLHVTSGT